MDMMKNDWKISPTACVLLRDGAANMVKMAREVNLVDESCFAHEIQVHSASFLIGLSTSTCTCLFSSSTWIVRT